MGKTPANRTQSSLSGNSMPTGIDASAADVTIPHAATPDVPPPPREEIGAIPVGAGKRKRVVSESQKKAMAEGRKKSAKWNKAARATTEFKLGRSRVWSAMRKASLGELARLNIENGGLAAAVEFLRNMWEHGLIVTQEYDAATEKWHETTKTINDPRLRLDALVEYMDRLFGKPVQSIELEKSDGEPVRNNINVTIERFQQFATQNNQIVEAVISEVGRVLPRAPALAAASVPGRQVDLPRDGDRRAQRGDGEPVVAARVAQAVREEPGRAA